VRWRTAGPGVSPVPAEETSLALAQAALVRSLAGGGEPPPGFDPARLQAMTQLLLDKRLRAASRVCPALRGVLGVRLASIFAEYAHSRPAGGDALVDALGFLRWLRANTGDLPDDLRVAAVELRLRAGPGVVLAWLPSERGLLAGIRLPMTRRPRFAHACLGERGG